MKKIIFAFFLIFAVNSQAQYFSPEYYNWHFGILSTITFNTADLEPINYGRSAMSSMAGCASISDMDANLLFYTNGENVWNRFNVIMPNGTELNGNFHSTQTATIIKKPGSDNLYYIFTVGKGPRNPPTPQDFCYSIVNMNEDFGNGDIIMKNIKIHNVDVVEKLTTVLHANNKDFWIIAHEINSDNFVVALLTEDGIQNVTTQNIGPIYDATGSSGYEVTIGQLKANVRGDRLAAVCVSRFDLDLFHFDRETGVISDHLPIKIDTVHGSYGLEFSLSGQFVYTTNGRQGKIYQFDLSDYDKNKIEQSRQIIFNNSSSFGSMQLAPNGKIYIAIDQVSSLPVINKPNLAGVNCDLQFNSVSLINSYSRKGLPNFCVTGLFGKLLLEGEDVCEDEDIEIEAEIFTSSFNYKFQWTGPNEFTSNLTKIKIENAKLIHEGFYKVEIYEFGGLQMKDSIYIKVHPYPNVKIIGQETICPPEKVVMRIDEIEAGTSYLWFNGSTNFDCEVSEPGRYFVVATSAAGCVDTAYFDVELSNDLDAKIIGPTGFCKGDTIKLTANKFKGLDFIDYSYLWSTGDTSRSIIVTEPGEYSLEIERLGGCIGYDTVHVTVYPDPDVQLSHTGIEKICYGQQLKIYVINPSLSNNYQWDDGIIGTERIITESGVYKIYSSSQYQCIDSAEVEVQFGDKPDVNVEFSNDLNICRGDSVTVTVTFDTDKNIILWNDGNTDLSRTFYESGKFQCVVSDGKSCSDTTEFEIKVFDVDKPEITASKFFVCDNDTLTLTANGDYASYLWSDGSTNSSMVVRNSGTYKVIVSNEIGCLDSAEIFIDASHIAFEFTQNNYEGDIKCTGEESTITLNLRNLTQNVTIIDEIVLENLIAFRVVSPNLPFTLAADETQEIIIAVNSLLPGNIETSIKAISNEPCYFETSTNLIQKFIQDISFRLPEIEAIAGEQLCIPIYGKINCGVSPFVSSATIQISFDAEYFNPINLKSGTNFTKVIENGICTVTIDYTSLNLTDSEQIIDELCGVVLVGQPETIPLRLTYDETNDFIESEFVDGSLKIEACAIQVRAIQYFTPTAMTISPLPANEDLNVTIESGSIGTFELILVAFDGTQEVLRTWENTQSSSVDLLFDLSTLSQGVYSLLLKAPWSIHYEQILILR